MVITIIILDGQLGGPFNENNIANDDPGPAVFKTQFDRIWNTAIYVARVAAFAGIFMLGVRYIFANADKKADLKKSLMPVIIGIMIFFGSTFIIDFVKRAFEEIANS